MTKAEIIRALQAAGLQPLKSLGQNFLIEESLCRAIAAEITSPPDDHWVEIGPGLGALTRVLLENGAGLTAIEIDQGLHRWLSEHFAGHPNLWLIKGDAVSELPKLQHISVAVGNLPYNISTPLLVEILKRPQLPREIVFTLQKETGLRFCASPASKDYGAVSVLLQSCYRVECLRNLGGDVFHPRPNVDSVVFRASLLEHVPEASLRPAFYSMLRRAFSQRRKKLRNTLGIDSDLRPEHLSVDAWLDVYAQTTKKDSPAGTGED